MSLYEGVDEVSGTELLFAHFLKTLCYVTVYISIMEVPPSGPL